MIVTIATCFESNEERVSFVYDACKSRGYDVKVVTSDFSHIRKEKRNNVPDGYVAIGTRPYRKNMSIQRMLSHRQFAKDAFALIEKQNPDLIWLMAPANSLIKEANNYKKKHPDKSIIIDIIDMWPESLPVSINKDLLPFRLWKSIRSKNINCCDHLVTECDLYQEILGNEYKGKIDTIRWARQEQSIRKANTIPDDKLSLVYIGSINNIIDPEKIADIIKEFEVPVILHVVGEGESKDHFIDVLEKVCELKYYGPVREESKKAEIFAKCHAGINIYKDGLYIGLTVKCIDYFEHGLPIINNIKGDTWKLVEEYNAGINVDGNRIDAQKLIEIRNNNQNIYKLFDDNFTKKVFTEKCLKVIDEVLQCD